MNHDNSTDPIPTAEDLEQQQVLAAVRQATADYHAVQQQLVAVTDRWHATIAAAAKVVPQHQIAAEARVSPERVRQIQLLRNSASQRMQQGQAGRPRRLSDQQVAEARELYSRHENGTRHYTKADIGRRWNVPLPTMGRYLKDTPLAADSTPAPPPTSATSATFVSTTARVNRPAQSRTRRARSRASRGTEATER